MLYNSSYNQPYLTTFVQFDYFRVVLKKLITYYLFLQLLCLTYFSSAQFPKFRNLTMADGLSGSIVYSFGQDKYGFIWIGTEQGLNIYDGINFKQIQSDSNNPTSIQESTISSMVFDNDSVWIGTRDGLVLMDIVTKKCKKINLGDNTDVRTLYFEKNHEILWVGTNSGLVKYNIKSGEFIEFNTENSNLTHNIVRDIYKDSDNNLWVATFNKLNVLSENSIVFKNFNLKKSYRPSIKNDLTLKILPYKKDNDSLLWIGTQTGLVLFNRFTEETKVFREDNSDLTNSVIKTIHRSADGELWIGTDFGLAQMKSDFNFQIYYHNPFEDHSLINSIVWNIFEDNSGTMWFGTNNGLSILPKTSTRFKFYPITFIRNKNISGYEIRDLIEDSNRNLWMATQFGIVQLNSENTIIREINSKSLLNNRLPINSISTLLEDKQGNIWASTSGGIVIWDPNTETLKSYTADFSSNGGLRSNYIHNIFELIDGTILIDTEKGLHKANYQNGEYTFEFVRDLGRIAALGDSCLWILNNDELIKTDLNLFENIVEKSFSENIYNSRLLSILITGKNTLWLGLNNGLIKYNAKTKDYNYFEIKTNKSYPLINLLSDNDGNIWASSISAILKFSPEKKEFEIYPSGDEIPVSRFMSNCCFNRSNGNLIFGGHDGFIEFFPSNITKADYLPSLQFTKLLISNLEINPGMVLKEKKILEKEIAFTKSLKLDYSNNSFSLEFSSLHFGNRNGIRYAYMLDGFEQDWNYINGSIGLATYSNLKSGKYTMRIKGTNYDGVWNPNETTLNIIIKPPLWASPVFILLYVVTLISIALILIYYYIYRFKMSNKLRIIKLEKEYSENLAQTRQQFFTNISHEFRTPLSLIIGPAEKLAQNNSLDSIGKNFVQLIEKNARRLLWLNNQLLEFRKLENKSLGININEFEIVEFARNIYFLFTDKAERKQIKYEFIANTEHLKVELDLRKIETILFNLLSNAFKFTPENGEISMQITSCFYNNKDGVCILVKDSGIGISEDDQQKIFNRFYQAKAALKMQRGSGIGLTLVNEYVKIHGGKIELKSQPGEGSEFKILLPLIVDIANENMIITEKETNEPLLKLNNNNKPDIEKFETYSTKPFVLLVEDDKEISDFIKISFHKKYEIKITTNGKIALQVISNQLPDIVICDIAMPVMDGIEFTKKFKSNPKTAHIPLILLTGKSQSEFQLEGLKSGADAYVTKPFEIDLLEVRIDNFLKRKIQIYEQLRLDNLSKPREINIESQDEKLLGKIVISIEKHISDSDLTVDKICAELGLSHIVIYRKIKNLTGFTVNEFIRTVRINRAEQLLRTKKFTVAEVMYETGFTSHSYFAKCFRKVYHLSPREYIDKL